MDYLPRPALVAFRMANTATPTSAKTASHMVAQPNTLNIKTTNLTIKANAMFSLATLMVFREIRMAFGKLRKSSFKRTKSAASTAASDPISPMATPTPARAKTGASLTPSPTKISVWSPVCSALTFSTFSWGRRPANHRVIPKLPAAAEAAFSRSPVSITVSRIPNL